MFNTQPPAPAEPQDQEMKCFYWDLDVGQALAFAPNVEDARMQIINVLPKHDAARLELAAMLRQEQPQILGASRKAMISWHT